LERKNTEHLWRERLIAYAPLILWIGIILFLSSSQGSMSETSRFIRPILLFLFPNAAEATLLVYHGYVRKFAHFAEYAVLGFLAARAFHNLAPAKVRKYWFAFASGLTVFVASLDEINQSLNPARTGSEGDVLLDVTGGIFALIVFWIIIGRRHERPSGPEESSE
jgi:VanZ family protein